MSRVICKAKLNVPFRKLLEVYPNIEDVVSSMGIRAKEGADDESGFEVKSRYYSVKNKLTDCIDELFLTNDFFTVDTEVVKEYFIKEESFFNFLRECSLPKDQWEVFQLAAAQQLDDESDYVMLCLKIDNMTQMIRIPKSNIGWY